MSRITCTLQIFLNTSLCMLDTISRPKPLCIHPQQQRAELRAASLNPLWEHIHSYALRSCSNLPPALGRSEVEPSNGGCDRNLSREPVSENFSRASSGTWEARSSPALEKTKYLPGRIAVLLGVLSAESRSGVTGPASSCQAMAFE